MSHEQLKETLCRFLRAMRAHNAHYSAVAYHLWRGFEVNMDVLAHEPLLEPVRQFIASVIQDENLLGWWYQNDGIDSYYDAAARKYVTLKTAEDLVDYYFKRNPVQGG
jgi:hypothetical protein